jgi:hypothetical protein
MPRAKSKQSDDTEVWAITENQQRFIEGLLAGKSISDAALLAGMSRRTVTYWLADPEHPVTVEYEKQRILARQQFNERVARLHELAFKAMEDSLSEAAPPALRFQAAKFLIEIHLEHYCRVSTPERAQELVEREATLVGERDYFQQFSAHRLDHVPD